VVRSHNFAVVGDLLVSNTQVRYLLTGQLLRTFAPDRLFVNTMPVPEQPHLLVTGERKGHVNLWDIETGEWVRACMYSTTCSGEHVRRLTALPPPRIQTHMAATATRLAFAHSMYDLTIVHFDM
jgi:hypothetical protein